jgi:succinate dehydrogenase/fumarate reductase flavoprotein subunit
MPDKFEADLLVVGAGMAGLTAGCVAAQAGAIVAVIEKSPQTGGSAALSGACLWTAQTYEQLHGECPAGEPELGRMLVESFPETLEWLRSTGVAFSKEVTVLRGRGKGHRIDMLAYLSRAETAIESAHGLVSRRTTVDSLLFDSGRRVVGARVRDDTGVTEVSAPWTLLATGGFQGNRGMLEYYFGQRAGRALLRSNPYSTGDGLHLGLSAECALSAVMDAAYGHLIASPLPEFTVRDYLRYACLYSTEGVLVNTDGQRFTREWRGDHWNMQFVMRQRQGRAVLVIDEAVHQDAAKSAPSEGLEAFDKLTDAAEAGARTASAASLDELGSHVSTWGYDMKGLPDAVREHSAEAADAGTRPLGKGPYHAIEVRPAITFTQGGLCVSPRAQALDAGGAPVPGLLVAGADAGGVYNGGYAGGLAMASVFGRAAAKTALGSPG